MNDANYDCNRIENTLPLYVGGDLERSELEAIDRHLAGCAPCTARALAANATREVFVSALEGRGSQRNLWPGVRAALVAEGRIAAQPPAARTLAVAAAPDAGVRRAGGRFSFVLPLGAAAAAAVLLGFALGRLNSSSPLGPELPGAVAMPNPTLAQSQPIVEQTALHVLPVSGLRRLSADESRLSESAPIFGAEAPWIDVYSPRDANAGSPASLEHVQPLR